MIKKILFSLMLFSIFGTIFYSCVKDDKITNEFTTIDDPDTFESKLIPNSYIVIFAKDAFRSSSEINRANYFEVRENTGIKINELLTEIGIKGKTLKQIFIKVYTGTALELTQQELEILKADRRIKLIEQEQTYNIVMGGPPGGGGGSGGQVTPWGVTRVGGAIDGTNSGKAWIIDSGIDLDHPDLNVDIANSVTFLGGNSTPDDQNGHGSHCAGIVGAKNNTEGSIGVATNATVVAVRVLDRRGSGSTSGVIAGVDYVAASAASGDAANMSLGGGVSTALDNAVIAASATCPFALAAGNESSDANNSSPARANGPNIYTVSSMADGDSWSYFSNYGNPPVDYCAPGSSVYSCYKNGGYSTLSGTSMAAPHVCGILLIGGITTSGNVIGDPDGNPDPIAHH